MRATSQPSIEDKETRPFKDYESLDDAFCSIAYSLLTRYKFFTLTKNGKRQIKRKEARFLLSNKIRINRPLAERLIKMLEDEGLIENHNQGIIVLENGGGQDE